jgi:hypothetical protein
VGHFCLIVTSAFLSGLGSRSRTFPNNCVGQVQRAIFHLLEEPAPTLADPFPPDDPLPGEYELYLPADGVTIWYVVTPSDGYEVITVQQVRVDT